MYSACHCRRAKPAHPIRIATIVPSRPIPRRRRAPGSECPGREANDADVSPPQVGWPSVGEFAHGVGENTVGSGFRGLQPAPIVERPAYTDSGCCERKGHVLPEGRAVPTGYAARDAAATAQAQDRACIVWSWRGCGSVRKCAGERWRGPVGSRVEHISTPRSGDVEQPRNQRQRTATSATARDCARRYLRAKRPSTR